MVIKKIITFLFLFILVGTLNVNAEENSSDLKIGEIKLYVRAENNESIYVRDNFFNSGQMIYFLIKEIGMFKKNSEGFNEYDVIIEVRDEEDKLVYSEKDLIKEKKIKLVDNKISLIEIGVPTKEIKTFGKFITTITVSDLVSSSSLTKEVKFRLSGFNKIKDCEDKLYIYRSNCYYDLAKKNKDIKFCAGVHSAQGRCIIALDAEKNHKSEELDYVCSSINSRSGRNACYLSMAVYKNNLDFCKKLEEEGVSNCILKVDKEKKQDLSKLDIVCSTVKNKFYRGLCYDRLASHRNEQSFCNRAENYKAICSVKAWINN